MKFNLSSLLCLSAVVWRKFLSFICIFPCGGLAGSPEQRIFYCYQERVGIIPRFLRYALPYRESISNARNNQRIHNNPQLNQWHTLVLQQL